MVFPSSVVHKDALVDVAMYFLMEKHFFWSISSIKMFIYHSYQLPVLVCYYMYKCLLIASVLVIFTVNKVQFLGGGGGGTHKKYRDALYFILFNFWGFFQGFVFTKQILKLLNLNYFDFIFAYNFSFSINLQTGPNINPRSNTALHFNPRLNDNCVVRNSYQHNSWGGEERGGYQPFQRGMPFEITILCQHHHYKVVNNVNLGEHLNNFSAQTS